MTVQVEVECRLLVTVGARWCLFVSDSVLFWSGHVQRVSEGYLSALYEIL